MLPPSARRQPMAPSESYLPRTVRLRNPGRKKLVMPYISDFKAYAAHETAAVEQLQRVWRGHCGRQVVAIRVSEAEMESRLLLLEKDALHADLRHAFPSSLACHCTSLAMLFRAANAFPSSLACHCLCCTCTCADDVSRCRSTWTAPSCADHPGSEAYHLRQPPRQLLWQGTSWRHSYHPAHGPQGAGHETQPTRAAKGKLLGARRRLQDAQSRSCRCSRYL